MAMHLARAREINKIYAQALNIFNNHKRFFVHLLIPAISKKSKPQLKYL